MYNTLHKIKLSHVFSRNFITEDFLPFKLLYKLVKKINWSKRVNKNGVAYTVLLKNGVGVMNFVSDYETWLDNILTKIIEKEDAVFIDIGANIGQTMLKVLPRYPKIRYYAIEPNPHCVSYLRALAEANNFNNVNIIDCAISDADGEIELLTRYGDDILATTTHSFRKFTKYAVKTKVRMTTGDAVINGAGVTEVAIIKIDIEGGESKAIAGLKESIKKFQPYILCEILPLPTEDEGVTSFRTLSANKILSDLQELNYIAVNLVTGETINSVENLSTSLESSNYIFMPQAKAPLLIKN
jgi:FkbM family methyltransferase